MPVTSRATYERLPSFTATLSTSLARRMTRMARPALPIGFGHRIVVSIKNLPRTSTPQTRRMSEATSYSPLGVASKFPRENLLITIRIAGVISEGSPRVRNTEV
jgi:hypothetical protein